MTIGLAGALWQILAGLVLVGVGSGLLLPTVNSWISTGTPAVVRGAGLGGLSTAVHVGQLVSPLLSSPLAAASGTSVVYTVAGGVAAAGGVGLAVVLSSHRHGRPGLARRTVPG